MKVLVVMAHPRRDSLTGQVADAVVSGLADAGHGTELADLYGEGFDPLIFPPDEPDWEDEGKVYSGAVRPRSSGCDATRGSSSSSRSGGGRSRRS